MTVRRLSYDCSAFFQHGISSSGGGGSTGGISVSSGSSGSCGRGDSHSGTGGSGGRLAMIADCPTTAAQQFNDFVNFAETLKINGTTIN